MEKEELNLHEVIEEKEQPILHEVIEEKEELNLYEVIEEEEEEETFTIDFENQMIISKEETLIVKETTNEPKQIQEPKTETEPSFKQEIQDVFFNKLTSKAIASLIAKQRELDTTIEEAISSKRMGKLNDILDREISAVLNKRRQELRNCYAGPIVKYEYVPAWAKGYIKEYIENTIHNMDVLLSED